MKSPWVPDDLPHGESALNVGSSGARSALTTPRKRFAAFLSAWLKKKQIRGSLQFFSQRALASPVILSEDCASYIAAADRGTPQAVRRGLVRFLGEFRGAAGSRNLSSILQVERFRDLEWIQGLQPVNDVRADRFLLLKVPAAGLREFPLWQHRIETSTFLSRRLKGDAIYVSLAVVKGSGAEAAFYAVWQLEGDTWSMIHLDLICA